MAEGRLLRLLLKAGTSSDGEAFRRAAEEVIREEREKKHHLLAADLERILYGSDRSGHVTKHRRETLPKDKERGLPVVDVRAGVRTLADLVLTDHVRSTLHEVLLEQSRREVLGAYGLRPVARLLFCGPPGCGKTSAAEALATELGIEFVLVRLDSVISSFLGETAANLRKVFDFISSGHFVVLFDEFDAIAKERDDPAEHGELKRVVNSFLQMVDDYSGYSILIAATNHERMLDLAVWRRFEEVLVFERPSMDQIRALLELKLRGVRHELPLRDSSFISHFKTMSHADIERVVIRAIKTMVLSGREFLTVGVMDDARRREDARQTLMLRPQ
jgi:SpoVK/Ycf46/Vps4 family AAA+-type ATPase